MKYKIGDMVIVHKPANTNQSPTWSYSMDRYDGKVGKILSLNRSTYGSFIYAEVDGLGSYIYNTEWFEPFCLDEDDEDIQAEDLSAILI